jgi:hypothetical protein
MATTPGAFERFAREARVAAGLSHPHIVPIYAIGDDPTLAWFAMKFIQGRGLDSILRKEGAQPIEKVVKTIADVGLALNHAHTGGVVHRDVKPANIMVGDDGWIYVTDFGIAKRDDGQGLTQAGTVIGTPAYMSPEQFNGAQVTGAADQYSLGVVAYEMLAGRTPFNAPSLGEIMRGHLLEPPPPLRTLRVDVPQPVAEVVNRMLEKDPAKRYPSLADAVSALETASQRTLTARGGMSKRSSEQMLTPTSSPTTPLPRPSAVLTSAQTRRPTIAQTRQSAIPEEKKGSVLVPVFLVLLLAIAGGAYVKRDELAARFVPPPRAPEAPVLDTIALAPTPAPSVIADSLVVIDSTAAAPVSESKAAIDSALAELAKSVNGAMQIDLEAPKDSVRVRVGSQTLQTVLFVNGLQVGVVGGRGLVGTTVAPGALSIQVKRVGCRDWDTTFTALAGKRYTLEERSPRC